MRLAIIAVLILAVSQPSSCSVPNSDLFGGGSAQPASIGCDHMYSFADQTGTFTIQRACGGSKAPWGYQLSTAVQAAAVGLVDERGMEWTLEGIEQPRQAPHLGVPPSYVFHGTFTAAAGDHVTYSDQLRYRHDIGSGGTVTVTIHGEMTFTDEPG